MIYPEWQKFPRAWIHSRMQLPRPMTAVALCQQHISFLFSYRRSVGTSQHAWGDCSMDLGKGKSFRGAET